MILDYLFFVWKQILARKRRSWLTLLGIVIGTVAIVSLMLVGSGLQNAIDIQLSSLGSDILFISPKAAAFAIGLSSESAPLTENDLDIISKTRGISETSGMIYTSGRIEFNNDVRYFYVSGMSDDPDERDLIGEGQSLKIGEGRVIEKGDKYKAVVGVDYTDENLFGRAAKIGDKILIQDHEFKIVGIWQPIGSDPDDRSVTIPIETYWDVFGGEGEYGFIIARAEAEEELSTIEARVTEELRDYRNVEEGKEDFTVQTPEQMAASFAAILDIVAAVLVGIATISLLVGGIGIMNTMFTAVLQRTREIGLLKAVGAKKNQILVLFLLESSLYGLAGGLIGVTIGVSFAKLVEWSFANFVGPNLFVIHIDYVLLVSVLVGSAIYGGLCGFIPARKAARADPVKSLRYDD